MRKTVAAATLTASLLGGGGLGALLFTPTFATAQDASGEDPATAADTEAPDRTARYRSALDDLVAAGTITAEQADAVAAALAETAPTPGRHHRSHVALDTVADELGLTLEELRAQLESGSTLGEVASANGSSPEALAAVLQAELDAGLAERVEAGELTQAEADERSAEGAERIAALVAGEGPVGGDGPRSGGRGGPGRGGFGRTAPAPDAAEDDAAA